MSYDISSTINEYLPLRDVVFHTLRQSILKGELEPGERLMELHLADRLGVSRTPIREAIRKLELEGLVVMIPRRGAVVASITEKDLEDVLEVRCNLEVFASQKACERITKEQLERLLIEAKHFEELKGQDDCNELAVSDMHFHEIIYEAASNPRLVAILNNLREQMYRYRMEYLKDKESHETLASEHYQIYEAIKGNNKEEVSKLVVQHIENQRKAIIESVLK